MGNEGWDNASTLPTGSRTPRRPLPKAMIAAVGFSFFAPPMCSLCRVYFMEFLLQCWRTADGSWATIGGYAGGELFGSSGSAS